MSRIGIFGAGYVGLVTGACFAELGHEVRIRDVVPETVDALRAGEVPIHEPGLDELLERTSERLIFTLDVGEAVDGAEFLFVCVDTPPTLLRRRRPLRRLDRRRRAARGLPGDARDEEHRAGRAPARRCARRSTRAASTHVGYVSNPEFIAEGRAVRDFMNPDRIVIGAFDEDDGDAVERCYEGSTRRSCACDVNSRRDGQARRERVPGDAHQLHQRDRERLRARRAPTS